MTNKAPDGFNVPLFKVCTQPLTFMGAPKSFTLINLIVLANLVMALHALWYIPMGVGLQYLGGYLCNKDPEFFEAFCRYFRQRDYLQP